MSSGRENGPGAGDGSNVIPLSRFAALLGRARGKKRLDLILSQPDPGVLVAEMPVQDLYYLIKEVGLADATELVELATPEQIQGFLDFDGWERDRLELDGLKPWLRALEEAGPEKLTQVFRGLDPELAALIFARWTRVYNLTEEEVPEHEEPPFYPTPDRFFLVKITAEDPEDVRLVERLLDFLYRVDPELARHLLRAASTETISYLEEMSYRWRSGRMEDLGYADYYEALEVYRPIDLATITVGEGTADRPPEPVGLPAPLAERTIRGGFFGAVLAHVVDPDEARRLEAAIVTLVNRVLSADRVSPGDLEAAARGAERAAATLSLGLEAVARIGARPGGAYTQADIERGREILRSVSLTRLHRAGHTVALQASRLAAALGPRAARAEEPWLSILSATRGQRPEFPRLLDEPPGQGTRPFQTLADVQRVVDRLAELALQIQFVYEYLRVDPREIGPGVTLGDVGRTAVANALLGRPLTQPISTRDLLELRRSPRELMPDAFPAEYSRLALGWKSEIESSLGGLVLE